MTDVRVDPRPPRVFISYRRQDAAGYAGRVYGDLASLLGKSEVFLDVFAIPPGVDFATHIDQRLATCESVLVVIGPDWISTTDSSGRPRLQLADDLVRVEVERALARKVRVIPLLVGGAVMPGRDELPTSIAGLAALNAFEISNLRWPADIQRLVDVVNRADAPAAPVVIPVPPSSLIGRRTEIDAMLDVVTGDDDRLVTVTGSGGIGKTRLALEVARRSVAAFAGGVYVVQLATVVEPIEVLSAIAYAIGADDHQGALAMEAITELLRDREVLLVLDNFEHVLDAATDVVALLASLPRLTVLVTSRAPLGVSGEREQPVDGLEREEAAELFMHRARARRPDIKFGDSEVGLVEEICGRLDGVPLSLELAAARVRTLSVSEIRARLDQSLSLLTAGPRDAPARQRTLRATIDWSVGLLTDDERALLGRLALFAGGVSLEAAIVTCGPNAEDGIDTLVSNNLLRRVERGGQTRFQLLQVMRQYAAESLLPPERWDEPMARLQTYFVSFAESWSAELDGTDGATAIERMDADYANLCTALDYEATAEGVVDQCARIVLAMTPYWLARGWISEGRRRVDDVLARQPSASLSAAVAVAAGRLAYIHSDFDEATRHLRAALSTGDALDADLRTLARCVLAAISVMTDDVTEARRVAEDALALAASREHYTSHVVALSTVALVAAMSGDFATEKAKYEERLALAQKRGDRLRTADTLATLGEIAFDSEDYDRAQTLVDAAFGIADSIGGPESCDALIMLARIALARNDPTRAERHLDDAVRRAAVIGRPDVLALCIRVAAATAGLRDDWARAAQLFGAARVVLGPDLPRTPPGEADLAASLARCQAELGAEQFGRERAIGEGLDFSHAVELAARRDIPRL